MTYEFWFRLPVLLRHPGGIPPRGPLPSPFLSRTCRRHVWCPGGGATLETQQVTSPALLGTLHVRGRARAGPRSLAFFSGGRHLTLHYLLSRIAAASSSRIAAPAVIDLARSHRNDVQRSNRGATEQLRRTGFPGREETKKESKETKTGWGHESGQREPSGNDSALESYAFRRKNVTPPWYVSLVETGIPVAYVTAKPRCLR